VLSATPLGGVIGFVFAIAFVFFIGVPVSFVAKTLNLSDFPLTFSQSIALLLGLCWLFVVALAVRAWRQRDLDKVRSAGFKAAALLVLPLMGWFSMVHAWR
jgi:predicted transporter